MHVHLLYRADSIVHMICHVLSHALAQSRKIKKKKYLTFRDGIQKHQARLKDEADDVDVLRGLCVRPSSHRSASSAEAPRGAAGTAPACARYPSSAKAPRTLRQVENAVLGIACDGQSIVNDFDENNRDAAIASVPGRPHPCGLLSHTNKDFTLESGTKKKKGE